MASEIGTIETGHQDIIHNAELDFYGKLLATCSSDGSVKIFDVKGKEAIADLKGHQGPVWQVAWAHPKFGCLLASCSYDRKVIVWKCTNGTEWAKYYEYNNHDSSVNSVSFAPPQYGLLLACGSSDGSVSILTCNIEYDNWESIKITNAHSIGCNAVSWSPSTRPDPDFHDSESTAPPEARRLASGGCDNCVKIWREDQDRWIEEQRLEAHSDWIRDVAWSPCLGVAHYQIASASQDRHVIVWSSSDLVNWTPNVVNSFDDAVWSVSWSTGGTILGVMGADNKFSLWKERLDGQWICVNEDASTVAQNTGTDQPSFSQTSGSELSST